MIADFGKIDLTLSDAFDFLGKHLYGSQWTGQELRCAQIPSPEDLRTKRAPIEKQVQELEAQMKGNPPDKQALIETRNALNNDLWKIGEVDEGYLSHYALYERQHETQRVLLQGLAAQRLQAHRPDGGPMPVAVWQGEEGFGYDIELSLVELPQIYSDKPQQAVRIGAGAFKEWIRSVKPLVEEAQALVPPFDQCRVFLQERIEQGAKTQTRDAYKAEAMAQIPGLSHRAFNHAWAQVMPDNWKKPGRPATRN